MILAAGAILAPSTQAAWSLRTSPNPSAATTSQLRGVDCRSTTACLAAAQTSTVGAFSETWGGTSWLLWMVTPPPASPSNFQDVSCPPATSTCFLVGSAAGAGMARATNLSTWSSLTVPTVAGAVSLELTGIACTSGTACIAVGWYQTAGGSTLPYAIRCTGTTCTQDRVTLPAGTQGSLEDVFCLSSTNCSAVGWSHAPAGARRTFVVAWNGVAWSSQVSANGTNAQSSTLFGVACASTACVAVGRYTDTSAVQHTLALGKSGSTWVDLVSPDPSGTLPTFEGIACPSATACYAVGSYANGSGRATLVESYVTGVWTVLSTPNPAGSTDNHLADVACVTTPSTVCRAVGYSVDTVGTTRTLVEDGP
ncbi:hypothetical protein [Baekduia alba]|uniref:hypothetical protein n=1 Tax=Baekduia alba TaxID=2997333 RepID=UPI002340CB29|nr:hypothetical protein [Baekduia alba]